MEAGSWSFVILCDRSELENRCANGAGTDFDYAALIKIYSLVGRFAKRIYSLVGQFLPRDAMLSAVYAVVVCLSVCVCLSDTLRYCIKTAKCRITQITPHVR